MKGTIALDDGRKIVVDIDEETLAAITYVEKNGYERNDERFEYYYVHTNEVLKAYDLMEGDATARYNSANYYATEALAAMNARADTLKRKLRRFSVEHRTDGLSWGNSKLKYCISYNHSKHQLEIVSDTTIQSSETTYFDTEKAAKDAMNKFKEDLTWYFTEYSDIIKGE